jgi:hypothetical protein
LLTKSRSVHLSRNFRLLFFLVLFLDQTNSLQAYSQSIEFLDGKVLNSDDGKPVPFATIKLKFNQLGVYANADGDFRINRNPDFQDDSLIITCIGFKLTSIAFKDLSDKNVNKIFLTPVVYGLAEVKVTASRRKYSSLAIIRRALRNIVNNYPDKSFNFISYYRDYQKKDSNYINLNEAIIQTFDEGFSTDSRSNKYKLLDFRKNMDFPRKNISPYYDLLSDNVSGNPYKTIPNAILGDQYGNELFVLMVHDALRNFQVRSFSFIETLSRDFTINHYFFEPSTVLNNNLLLYKIDFKTKPYVSGDSITATGTIYIQPKDYSIHKLEYSGWSLNKKKVKKLIYKVVVEYGYENSINSKMYLKYISFNNIFNVTDSTDNSCLKVLNSYLDIQQNVNPVVSIVFNNKIDRVSGSKKENYQLKIGNMNVKINNIQVTGKTVYLRFKKEYLRKGQNKCQVFVKDVKDVNGNIVNQQKAVEYYQFRELFVQDYNKTLPYQDSCYLQYMPLEQNCISKYSGNFNYWMNTPQNIRGK